MKVKAYIYHKRAEKYSDCQDCFGINTQNNRIAVSDGMSQSIFPQWWAQILVDYYLENGCIPQDIHPLQEKWQRMLCTEIEHREKEAITNPKRDPWRLKNLLAEKSGAGATLCGLTLGDSEWTCECLGDSCVIGINHDYSLNFYTSQVGEFGNHPDYFDSFGKGRGEAIKKSVNRDVRAILIVTDPFAELFMIHENNYDFIKQRIKELTNLNNHKSFSELVENWRDMYGMHNDDSTLVLIDDISKSGFTIEYSDNLTELCVGEGTIKNENRTLQQTLSENILSKTNICAEPEAISSTQTYEDAINQFKIATESLLSFCTAKKRKKWLCKHLKETIKEFKKK